MRLFSVSTILGVGALLPAIVTANNGLAGPLETEKTVKNGGRNECTSEVSKSNFIRKYVIGPFRNQLTSYELTCAG